MKTLQIILLITGILVAGIAFNTVAQTNEPGVARKELAFKQEKDKINKDKNKNKNKIDKEKNKNKNKNKEKDKDKDKQKEDESRA